MTDEHVKINVPVTQQRGEFSSVSSGQIKQIQIALQSEHWGSHLIASGMWSDEWQQIYGEWLELHDLTNEE